MQNKMPEQYKKVQEDLEKVIIYAKSYEKINIDCTNIMQQWYENKRFLIDLFGGKLIYTFPKTIEIELTDKEKNKMFDNFLREIEIYLEDNPKFNNFLESNREGFYLNLVVNDQFNIPRLRKGDKLMKSFKYFVNDESELRRLQDIASRYIQKTKIKGKLCLSIHPLDYLTISENNSGWRSCHSMDGDFGGGNMNYLVDKSTFVIYLRSTEDEQLKCFPEGMLWNNKKWRVLGYANKDLNCVWFGKHYPFFCRQLTDELTRSADSPFYPLHFYSGTKFVGIEGLILSDGTKTQAEDTHCVFLNDNIFDVRDIVKQNEDENVCNFNDITAAFHGCPASMIIKSYFGINHMVNDHWTDDPKILYKVEVGETYKPICGHDLPFWDPTTDFICTDCGNIAAKSLQKCECCGRTVYNTEKELKWYQEYEDEHLLVCPECYKELMQLKENE